MKWLIGLLVFVGVCMAGSWVYRFSKLKSPAPKPTPALPVVSATIYPLYDIVRQVAGNGVTVNLLVPPGTDPVSFIPTEQTTTDVSDSAIVFAIGHGLEPWVASTGATIVPVDANSTLLPEDNSYYFLSLKNAIAITQTVRDQLSNRFPDKSDTFAQNAKDYIDQIQQLDHQTLTASQSVIVKGVATTNTAWDYLAGDYHLTPVHIPTTVTSPQKVQALKAELADSHITTIFAGPEVDNNTLITLAKTYNVSANHMDPYGGSIDRDTYLGLMQSTLNQIFNQK